MASRMMQLPQWKAERTPKIYHTINILLKKHDFFEKKSKKIFSGSVGSVRPLLIYGATLPTLPKKV